jgi:glycosyltransferase involved in cell wall biosynthesis
LNTLRSLHVIGSKEMGGAERWFVRFLRAMRRHGEPAEAVVRSGSRLAREHLESVPTHASPMRTVWDPWSRHRLNRLIRAHGAPIVQTYMGRASRLTSLERGRGQVHVARLGGYYRLGPFRHAHAWIGNTRGLCDWMIAQGLPADRVFHIYNFADPAPAVPAARLDELRRQVDARPDDLLMITAGRLIDVKGQRYLIDALARLPAQVAGRRLRLLVLGDGPLAEPLRDQARQLGIDDRVAWLGWQQEPAPWFELADLVVFPSRDAETLGNVILEAWSHGRPLVASAFRGAREIVRHGEDGWLVPCDDAAALAAGIETVLRDPSLAAAIADAGRARVERDFSEDVIIARYRELYRQLLGG